MAWYYKVLLALAVIVLIAVGGVCDWLLLYTSDLPEIEHLSVFAPTTARLATDSCLAGLSFAIPFDGIGKSFQDALASAEPAIRFSDQIAGTLLCNRHERAARYELDEFRLSWHIRRRFSEQQLFTIYVNRAYFGPGATGVGNASEHFFQKNANSLSTEEAALLAGVLRAPALYSPFRHPDIALQRRNRVLEAMAARGKLSATEVATAIAHPIDTRSLGNTEAEPLPDGVLQALAADQSEYCDEFDGEFKKGCEETFRVNLAWRALPVGPGETPGILVENRNTGFCGSAGCALRLFIVQPDGRFVQTLGEDGDVGDLDRISVLKTIANDHYNIQKTWADGKAHTIYRWRGLRYSAD